MDNIIIKGLHVFAHHGVLQEEKDNGQNFYLDIVLSADLFDASVSDNLYDTINYDEVCRVAKETMTLHTYDLIERAAGAVIDSLFEEFPMVEHIDLTLRKPEAPLCCEVEYAAVRFQRSREFWENQ